LNTVYFHPMGDPAPSRSSQERRKRHHSSQTSTFTFIFNGTTVPVPEYFLLANLALFRDQPSLLEAKFCVVNSPVPNDVFQSFLQSLQNQPATPTLSNVSFLLSLCAEFGFDRLKAECESAFQFDVKGDMRTRISRLEECFLSQEESLLGQCSELRDRLSAVDSKVSRIETLFTDEQLCERGQFLVGQKSPGDVETGLWALKKAIERGHGESAFRYGEALRLKPRGIDSLGGPAEIAAAYRLSSEMGCELGREFYGYCLRYGFGVERDLQEASEYISIPEDRLQFWACRDENEPPVGFCATLEQLRLNPDDRTNGRTHHLSIQLVNRSTGKFSLADRDGYSRLEDFELWRSLNHPNLIRKIGVVLTSDDSYYSAGWMAVHEWYPRGSFGTLLSNRDELGKLSPTDKMRIIVGMVLGLRYLHQRGLGQNFFSPNCIFLTEDLGVRLVSLLAPEILDETPLGQWGYYAPPICASAGQWEPAADVYEFGIMLWELLTGIRFASTWELKHGRRAPPCHVIVCMGRSERPSLDGVPRAAAALIQHLWRSHPENRFTMEQVFERLKEMNYELIPGVNTAEIKIYVDSILEAERAMQPPGSA
jgi:hypothetical protein